MSGLGPCPLCGGTLGTRRFQEVRAAVCAACGAVVLDVGAGAMLLGPADDPTEEAGGGRPEAASGEAPTVEASPPTPLPASDPVGTPPTADLTAAEEEQEERKWLLRAALVVGVLTAVVAVPLLLLVQRQTPPEATNDGGGTPGQEASADGAVPGSTAEVPSAAGVQGLVSEGWTLVGDQPALAADRFRAALALAPRDGGASYGLGYALLRLGSKDEAREHLCLAKDRTEPETSREVASLLQHEGLACSP